MSTSWSNAMQRAVTRISANDRGVGVRTASTSTVPVRTPTALGLDTTYAHLARARSTPPANPTNSQLTDRQTLTLRILQDVFGMPGSEANASPRSTIASFSAQRTPAELPDLGGILRGWSRTLAGEDTAPTPTTPA